MPRRGGGQGKYKSLKTGRYVSAYYAKRHPTTTVPVDHSSEVEMEEKPNKWCCEVSCENDAVSKTANLGESVDPYDYTHACEEHVTEMLYEHSHVNLLEQARDFATPTK